LKKFNFIKVFFKEIHDNVKLSPRVLS